MARTNESQKLDCVAALFSYEFASTRVLYDTIEALHRGDVGRWVAGLAASGLFSSADVHEFGTHWAAQPKDLLDLLLTDADEVTVRRCRTTWSALDRLAPLTVAPLTVPIAHSG